MELIGKLIVIGGVENKDENCTKIKHFVDPELLSSIIKSTGKGSFAQIEIVTIASCDSDKVGSLYLEAFQKIGIENVGIIHANTREEAEVASVIERISNADLIIFTGGDQIRLTSILGGSTFFSIIKERLSTESDFTYVGTCAGAAAVSEIMTRSGEVAHTINKGDFHTGMGFGFINSVIFETDFTLPGRMGRLFQIALTNPKIVGVGLEKNSALIIQGEKMESIGSGMVLIVDGNEIKNTNFFDIKPGMPLSIENLKLHVMSRLDFYDIEKRELIINTPVIL